jgi:hypothetical protein
MAAFPPSRTNFRRELAPAATPGHFLEAEMPKIKFIHDWTVKQGDGKGPRYKAGDVVDLEFSYAEKYKQRGLAVDHVEEVVEAPIAAGPVEIPEGWRELSGGKLRALASQITGRQIHVKSEAFTIIENEEASRASGADSLSS